MHSNIYRYTMMDNGSLYKTYEMLSAFYKHSANRQLIEKFNERTYFDIIGKETSESVHSKFLEEIFSYDWPIPHYYKPIVTFLRAVLDRAYKSGKIEEFPIEIDSLLFSNPEVFSIRKVETEYPCKGIIFRNGKKGIRDGYADLVIDCEINAKNEERKQLKIILENKIGSKEHDFQTWRYYAYFHHLSPEEAEKNKIFLIKRKSEYIRNTEELQLFVFLTPHSNTLLEQVYNQVSSPYCSCPHYIHINYQDILDYVLTPLVEYSNIDIRRKNFLEEYITSLGRPNKKTNTIMALTDKDKQLLKDFWNANQDLITAAIDAFADSGDDESNKAAEAVKKAISDMNKVQRHYDVFFKNQSIASGLLMADVFKQIVISILDNNPEINIKDLNDQIKEGFKRNTGSNRNTDLIISHSDYLRKKEESKQTSSRFRSRWRKTDYNHDIIYTTTQWSADNFEVFKKLLSEYYPAYEII